MDEINFNDPKLKIFRNLVNINDIDLKNIFTNLNKSKDIQLLDYIYYLGLPKNLIKAIKNNLTQSIPEEREEYFREYKRTILSLRTTEHNLSNLRLNPLTEFEKHPPLFFGMGGGSKELCKGLPFDVLAMLLTGEKIKRNLKLSECRILLANRITYTNIPKNPEFSEIAIDNVMNGEKDLLKLVINKFGFQNWKIFLQTDLEKIVGNKIKNGYEKLIQVADKTELVGGHHYSIEMADIWALVGQENGGVKLGWFIRNLDKENGGYIMDEQPFHARFNLFMALHGLKNNVTLTYANAGARLYPGPTGALEKESPYICYQPENRLLLSPFEQPIKKLKEATLAGGGFQFKYYRNLMSGIINLFEELVLNDGDKGKNNKITVKENGKFRGDILAQKIEYIHNYIFSEATSAKNIWSKAFPNSL
ncbi:hypothetical protein KKA93_03110 [Patescibacteria group bacterium]|nr:hypothetical protein [Patescibacteria group bacterium]MBU1663164.1 hypothetical protein [Patescibacteria group bacterium]MBU1934260.1 hypothetical protein [Patescibacteria group bacterium]MBU2007691.1 hypothetical protein [Patescibacteria group bacterium]MBU2233841.1 hypothetical protein [Patescibacteria group bacterium]